MSAEPALDLLSLPWRTGRHNGRAIYAQALCMDDVMVGVMDSPELAAEVCEAHNARLVVHPGAAEANGLIRAALRAR